MAGRGIFIIVQLLDGATGVEEMSLPVALHTPLVVLRDRLFDATGIEAAQQVIILCDLADKERNNDKVLGSGLNTLSLRDCGIKNGSTLTLHSLGMTSELKAKILKDAETAAAAAAAAASKKAVGEKSYTLTTEIGAAKANHSYAGVIFDAQVKGPNEVDITSFAVGGMLGRVRIFARSKPWEAGPDPYSPVEARGWTLVADTVCRPSWDRHCTIPLKKPFRMMPHRKHGFYIHSSLPGDLGIQYQSYPKDKQVAQDDFLVLTPGIGHAVRHDVDTCEPFDQADSWYRQYRCMAGSITYHARRKGWGPQCHRVFPQELRRGVFSMLLCQLRPFSQTRAPFSFMSDKHLVYNIMEFCHWDWFMPPDETSEEEDDEDEVFGAGRPLSLQDQLRMLLQDNTGAAPPPGLFQQLFDQMFDPSSALIGAGSGVDSDDDDDGDWSEGNDDDDDDDGDDEDEEEDEEEEDEEGGGEVVKEDD